MKWKVETLPDYRIAYMRRIGPYGPANTQVMEKLKKWAREENLLHHSTVLLAIPQDNPGITPPESCRFDACIVIPPDIQLDGSISVAEQPGGNYIINEVNHTAEHIQQAYSEIPLSLQSNGYQMDNKPIVERYIGDMNENPFCEICVPIKE
ncbi:AraC family transcriptional regulator [Gracilibacillus ureilyticus]|nr:GyrI-like domain-containing protein [Gracilibacillus ureilyticus]